ncbi:MAG TPA: histidine kinase, partial [Geobacteraceae bacterium]
MDLVRKIKNLLNYRTPGDEIARLTGERDELVQRERTAYTYIRRKINHLLKIMGTLPLRPEELDDRTLLELDPIGIIADSFTQVLEHLNTTNDKLRLAQEELQAVLATAGVGIVVVDDAMRIQTYNLKAKELFFRDGGLPPGGTCHELLCGSALPPKECTFEKVKTSRIG